MALTRITKGVIKPNENYDTHNINSTGIVTAIGLDVNGNGDISGNLNVGGVLTYEDVTSIDSVGLITARGGIDCNGDLDVDGHTNLDNVSVAGIMTVSTSTQYHGYKLGNNSNIVAELVGLTGSNDTGALALWSGGSKYIQLSAQGNSFLNGGDVSIEKDLDVDGHTNLDNVNVAGVSTFTGEIDHNSTLTTVKLKVNSTNAQIDLTSGQNSFTRYGAINHYHNNSTSTIHNQIKLAPRNGGTGRIMFYNLGGGSLTEKFRIDGTDGVQTLNDTNLSVAGDTTLTGDLDVDGHTNLDNVSIAGVTTTTGNIHLNSGAKVGFATDSNTFIGQDDYDRLDFNVGGKRLASIVEGTNIPVLVIDKDGINNARSNQNTNYNANPHATELVLGNTSSNNHGMTIVSPSSGYGSIQFSDGSGGGLDATRGSIVFTHSDNKLNLKSKIGSIALTHKDVEKLVTTDAGISIPKDLDVDGHTNLDNVSIAGVTTFASNVDIDGNTTFGANGSITSSADFHLSSNSLRVTGGSTVVGEFKGATIPTIQVTQTTNNTDLQLRADSNGGLVRTATNTSLNLGTNQKKRIQITADGKVQIGLPGNVESLAGGVEVVNIRAMTDGNLIVRAIGSISGAPSGSGVGIDVLNDANNAVKDLALRGSTVIFKGASAETLRINSSGSVSIGNNPTVHSDTIFHVEKSSGETNVKFEGNDTMGARLQLHNNSTSGSAKNQIDFCDAGGQSTSSIQGFNTDQTNNLGELVFATRSAQGSPPAERLRITSAGQLNVGTSSVLKAIINESSISGHQFISQCADNHNGFEIYQQHGSTTTRNTLAVYANTGSSGAKQIQFAVRGDGNVTKPSNCCFQAVVNGGHVSAGTYVVFGSVDINIGNDYDSSTGIFTAPVAGTYLFHISSIAHNNSSTVFRFYLKINNGNTGSGSDAHLRLDMNNDDTDYAPNASWTYYKYMSANDTARVYFQPDNNSAQSYGPADYFKFAGHLVG